MGIMKDFQEKKRKDPEYGTRKDGGFTVVAAMPRTRIGRQKTMANLEQELREDLASLKMIRSIQTKESTKAESLVPKYMPVVRTLVADGSDHPLLGQILVWLFDIKDIPEAMALAAHCIEKQVPMPERFNRDLPVFLCDTIIEWAENEYEADRSCEPYFSQVFDMSRDWDIPDEVSAKFFRLRGLIAMKAEDFARAVKEFETAVEFGAKVKTVLKEAEKQAEKQAEKKQAANTADQDE